MPNRPRPKVLLDTNVLVSAAIAGGRPGRIVELVLVGELEGVIASISLVELAAVLTKKIGMSRSDVEQLIRTLAQSTEIVRPSPVAERIKDQPADSEIIAAAVESGADYLVSGDSKHILPLGHVGGVRMISPQQLLAELSRK